MTMMTPPPPLDEDEEMLVPNSDYTDGIDTMEPAQGESVSTVENQPTEEPPLFKFTWPIEHVSRLNVKKCYSDVFIVGGYKWRVLIFPKGNNVDHLSIYLDVADSATLPYGWSRYAFFSLAIVNQIHHKFTVKKETQHQFNARESDWGFTSFMPLLDVYDPTKGYLIDDTLIVEAEVSARRVPDYWAYDSKKQTGFVGLKNQGATCYMNSLLQTLYHIPYFRKAVYHMPTTENDIPSKSIPLALQSLFYKVQYSDTSVSTKDLTKSFGWDTYDSFMQHDVQELNRVLCEKLEDKMKGTAVEDTIKHLFEGHHMNYIECINVDYKSTRKESFYDLQLDVKGCRDVYASFDKYVEVEQLDGDNKYHAEQYGLQDARKGVLFLDFPPVLQLQLKRFEYDFMRDTMVKINDRYEFPLQLDLDRDNGKYLSPNADRSVRNLYTLHSVLVHSGGVHGGHYYAFIRPTLSDQWYKFDDERVTKEEVKRALEEQYGVEEEPNPGLINSPGFINSPFKFRECCNAYMLVYIRESDKDKIICNVDEKDIVEHRRVRLKKEQEEKGKKWKEKTEAHLYIDIKEDKEMLVPNIDYTDGIDTMEPAQGESVSTVENQPTEEPPLFKFTWRIEHLSRLNVKKHYSDVFIVGGYKWRVLIFPEGNNASRLSIYLDVADSATLPDSWSRDAYFSLAIVNQICHKCTVKKEAQQQFNARGSCRGFRTFMDLCDVYDPTEGYVIDDTLIVEAEFIERRVPDYWAYYSKKQTGFVGLENQGETHYMNSLLQTLYHIPYFRKAVYHMPTTENDIPSKSIPLALQRLFYKLQYSDTSVSTKDLTKSFIWDTYDSFMQQDVQELNRVLCEKLEDKMKGIDVEDAIKHLFEGHHMNYIECINVDYKSTRKESFYDLQLDVKGCRDVYASFDKYVEVKQPDGFNKYHAEQYGPQDARKGVLFHDFPPVLQLRLKRFEYNIMKGKMVKINDRYEFPLQLDLDRDNGKYLSPDADKSVRNLYTLHSVLVHCGGVHGGHYYAFIRPTLSDQWYKFEDECVTNEEVKRALEGQYGGEDEVKYVRKDSVHFLCWSGLLNSTRLLRKRFKLKRYYNAYMLVYIRESDKDKIICDVDEKDIAEHLRVRLKKEQEEKEKKPKEKTEAYLFTNIKTVRFRRLDKPKEDVFSFCLELSMLDPYDDVVKRVANQLGLDDPSKLRLTSHDCYSRQPKPQPIKHRGVDHLSDMLEHYNQISDILYYEVLDIPLSELQGLKSLKVTFHHAMKDEISVHVIRLPKDSTVGDVLNELKTKVELSNPNAELRLLELYDHKINKIFNIEENTENINDEYWTLRAEEIPEEERNLSPGDRLIHVYHFNKDSSQNHIIQKFGEPFFFVIREGEILSEVKERIKKKLQVPDEEFAKWKFAFLYLGRPEYLQDTDIVYHRFQRRDVYVAWEQSLGLEHSDNTSKRIHQVSQEDKQMLVRNSDYINGIDTMEPEVSARDYWAYDSKKQTGFVGLKNQGATCYLNSLLQTLYHIPYFRKAVYHMPTTENDIPSESIPLALQSLFYKLQYSDTSVSTEDLTKSFGWESSDCFVHRDVHEENLKFIQQLENKVKGTAVEDTIKHLFEGHHMNYVECINVDCESTRKESFYDLQLDVKGCRDVYASFDKRVEVEQLDGDNKYDAEQYGLQDAKKVVLFLDFPPVLQLQLKRFEYDFMRDTMVKINDRYEFPLQLDLDRDDGKYLSPDADRSVRNLYTLHSVLVHCGGVQGGHYYAFIRPTLSDQWYKFDDECVTKEEVKRALEEQYGGEEELPQRNAYVLVYIRESDKDKIICNVDEKDIAEHLRVRLKKEQEEKEKKWKEKPEVSRDEDLADQIGKDIYFDLVDHDKVRSLRVQKQQPFASLKLFLS